MHYTIAMRSFYRFTACLLLAFLFLPACGGGCNEREPDVADMTSAQEDMALSCEASPPCEEGGYACDRAGQVRQCVLDERGCLVFSEEEGDACEDGKYCSGGGCFSPPSFAAPRARSEFESGFSPFVQESHAVGDGVVVIPQDAFEAAIRGDRYHEPATPELIDRAANLAAQANDVKILGLRTLATYPEDDADVVSFSGDLFIVLIDPVYEQGRAPSRERQSALIETEHYYVAVANGLSGVAPYVGIGSELVAAEPGDLGVSECCSDTGLLCDPEEAGPSAPDTPGCGTDGGGIGGGMLEEERQECPPDVFERQQALFAPYTSPAGDTPFRVGAPGTDPDASNPRRVITRGNGLSVVGLYVFEPGQTGDEGSALSVVPRVDCEKCFAIACEEPGSDFDVGEPTGEECLPAVPELCQLISASMPGEGVPAQCGGVVQPKLDCLSAQLDAPLHSTFQQGAGEIQAASCTSSSLPEQCAYTYCPDGDAACAERCDPSGEDPGHKRMREALLDLRGCAGARDLGEDVTCCGDRDRDFCACKKLSPGIEECTRCNANGDCTTFREGEAATFGGGLITKCARDEKTGEVTKCRTFRCLDSSCENPPAKRDMEEEKRQREERREARALRRAARQKNRNARRDRRAEAIASRSDVDQGRGDSGARNDRVERAPGEKGSVGNDPTHTDPDPYSGDGRVARQITDQMTRRGDPVVSGPAGGTNDSTPGNGTGSRGRAPYSPDKKQHPKAGDPVVLSSGAVLMEAVDISMPGAIQPTNFERIYTSNSSERGVLGSNWQHNWSTWLEPIQRDNAPFWARQDLLDDTDVAPRAVMIHSPDGTSQAFWMDRMAKEVMGMDVYMPQAGSGATVYFLSAFGWVLRKEDGDVFVFNEFGSLTQVADRFGNGFSLEYEPTPYLRGILRYCKQVDSLDYWAQDDNFDVRLCEILLSELGYVSRPTLGGEGWLTSVSTRPLKLPIENYANPFARLLESSAMRPPLDDGDEITAAASIGTYWPVLLADRSYLERWLASGVLPRALTGAARQRLVTIFDDQGRELHLEYFDDSNDPVRYGLLKQVKGPQGIRVSYEYDRPTLYPSRLNESFLTHVVREDMDPTSEKIARSKRREITYHYQWPGNVDNYPSWDTMDTEGLRDAYLGYYQSVAGCRFGDTNISLCAIEGSGQGAEEICAMAQGCIPTSSRCVTMQQFDAWGNPCFMASSQVDEMISQVADNITRVERNGTLEATTFFDPDPYSLTFDRATVQHYGGLAASAYTAPVSAPDPGQTLPKYSLDYLAAGPIDGTLRVDRTETSFLPQELKSRFALEQLPENFGQPDGQGGEPGTVCNPSLESLAGEYQATCDWSTYEHTNREDAYCALGEKRTLALENLPGPAHRLSWYPIGPSPSQDPSHPSLVRSRLDCSTIAFRWAADPTSNATLFHLDQDGWSVVPGARAAIQADSRRICAWTKVTERDGDVRYVGMNFRGQALVSALEKRDGSGMLVHETLYNADGLPIEVRHTSPSSRQWEEGDGYTLATYEAIDEEKHLGKLSWWSRRGNLESVRRYPGLGEQPRDVWFHDSQGSDAPEVAFFDRPIEYLETRYEHEPFFNQVHRQTLAVKHEGASEAIELSGEENIFDFQELTADELVKIVFEQPGARVRYNLNPTMERFSGSRSGLMEEQSEVRLFGKDINGDRTRDLEQIYGGVIKTTRFGLSRHKGENPELIEEHDEHHSYVVLTPHGLPRSVTSSTGERVVYSYMTEGELELDSSWSVAQGSSSSIPGFLGAVVYQRFDHEAPEDGPYKDVPGVGRAAQKESLEALGMTEEVASLLLDQGLTDRIAVAFGYDELGHLHKTTHHPDSRYATTTIHDQSGWPVREVDELGVMVRRRYSPDGLVLLEVIEEPANNTLSRVWYQHDMEGRVLTACQDVRLTASGGCAALLGVSSECSGLQGEECAQQFLALAPLPTDTARQLQDPDFLLTTLRYSPEGVLTERIDPLGVKELFVHDERDLVLSRRLQDPEGLLADRVVMFEYDMRGRMVRARYGDPSTGDVLEHSARHDGFDRLVSQTDVRGREWSYAYGARGEKAEVRGGPQDHRFLWDGLGRHVLSLRYPGGGTITPISWTRSIYHADDFEPIQIANSHGEIHNFAYNAMGELLFREDAHGNQQISIPLPERRAHYNISLAPDGQDYLITTHFEEGIFDLSDTERVATYGHGGTMRSLVRTRYDGLGRPITRYDEGNTASTYQYDLAGRLVRTEEERSAGGMSYDVSTIVRHASGAPLVVDEPQGAVHQRRYLYDGFGQVKGLVLPQDPGTESVRVEYDHFGRVSARELARSDRTYDRLNYTREPGGQVAKLDWSAPNAPGPLLVFEADHDNLGRVTRSVSHNPSAALLGAGGFDASVEHRYVYEGAGRLAQDTLMFAGTSPEARGHVVGYDYIDPLSGAMPWQTSMTYPSGRVVSRSKNAIGLVGEIEDLTSGATFAFEYLGAQQTNRVRRESGSFQIERHQERDARNRLMAVTEQIVGLEQHAADASRYCLGYAFNAVSCGGSLYELELKHDRFSRVATERERLMYPRENTAGDALDHALFLPFPIKMFQYDGQHRLSRQLENKGVSLAEYQALVSHNLDDAALDALHAKTPGQAWAHRRSAAGGDLLAIEEERALMPPRFEHVDGSSLSRRDYKPGHLLSAVSLPGRTADVEYDGQGRVTRFDGKELSWDILGRLVGVRAQGSMVWEEIYLYDLRGRLSHIHRDDGEDLDLVWDKDDLIGAYRTDGTPAVEYVWGGGLQELLEVIRDGSALYPIQDRRRNIIGLFDVDSMLVTDHFEYDTQGFASSIDPVTQQVVCEGRNASGGCVGDEHTSLLGFGASLTSKTSGLVYMRNRWYSPHTSQFISRDPLGYIDGDNPYAYAAFDPINSWDPYGLASTGLDLGEVAQGAGEAVAPMVVFGVGTIVAGPGVAVGGALLVASAAPDALEKAADIWVEGDKRGFDTKEKLELLSLEVARLAGITDLIEAREGTDYFGNPLGSGERSKRLGRGVATVLTSILGGAVAGGAASKGASAATKGARLGNRLNSARDAVKGALKSLKKSKSQSQEVPPLHLELARGDNFGDNYHYHVEPVPGMYDVVAHGNSRYIQDGPNGSNGPHVLPRELAERIRNDPEYSEGSMVRLVSCNTGGCEGSFASQLAVELDVHVMAPDAYVFPQKNGNILLHVDKALLVRYSSKIERDYMLKNTGWWVHDPDGSVSRSAVRFDGMTSK